MDEEELARASAVCAAYPGPYCITSDPVYWINCRTGTPINTVVVVELAEAVPGLLARIAELTAKLRWYRARHIGPWPEPCPRGGYHEPSIGSPACYKCGIAYGEDSD
jgi:hypothetical protein